MSRRVVFLNDDEIEALRAVIDATPHDLDMVLDSAIAQLRAAQCPIRVLHARATPAQVCPECGTPGGKDR